MASMYHVSLLQRKKKKKGKEEKEAGGGGNESQNYCKHWNQNYPTLRLLHETPSSNKPKGRKQNYI